MGAVLHRGQALLRYLGGSPQEIGEFCGFRTPSRLARLMHSGAAVIRNPVVGKGGNAVLRQIGATLVVILVIAGYGAPTPIEGQFRSATRKNNEKHGRTLDNGCGSWLSDLTSVDLRIAEGRMRRCDGDPGRAIRNLPRVVENLGRSSLVGGADIMLAEAIRHGRARAHRAGVHRLPDDVVDLMRPYLPGHILRKARYTTDWGAAANGTLQQLVVGNGMAQAMVLDDVIVFRDRRALDEPWLWAHELAHVLQYDQMGIQGFAHQYVLSHRSLERVADRLANDVVEDLERVNRQAYYCVAVNAWVSVEQSYVSGSRCSFRDNLGYWVRGWVVRR